MPRINPRIALAIVYITAMVMDGLDATIVSPALLHIGETFGIAPAATHLIETSFLIAFAVVVPLAGWLGDRWESKRVFLAALGCFTAASLACGAAPTFELLTLCRVVQGLSGGLLAPVGMAMMFRAFSPEERLTVARYVAVPTTLAPAIGPILGGWLTDALSWRWMFFLNVPLGSAAVILGMLYVAKQPDMSKTRFDWRGFVIGSTGLALLLYALGAHPMPLGGAALGLIGMVLLGVFVALSLRTAQPLLDLRLFADSNFRAGAWIAMCAASGLFGVLYLFPLMYQAAIGASALDAGFTIFPEALGLLAASQLIGWTFPRLGPRPTIALGVLLAGTMVLGLTIIDASTNPWIVRSLMFGIGLFLGHAVLAVQVVAFDTVAPAAMGQAMSLFTVLRQIGAALGVALAAQMLASQGSVFNQLMPYRCALVGCALLLGAALVWVAPLRRAQAPAFHGVAE